MKKTLAALAVAAFAAGTVSTANAVEVYNQDGAKLEIGGSFRAYAGKTADATTATDKRSDLKNDGSRINIKASQDLGNGLSAFVGYELRFSGSDNAEKKQVSASSNFGSPSTRQLFAGLKYADIGALSFGRQATNVDDILLTDADYYKSGNYGPMTTRSDKSVKFRSAEWSGFSFGADYLFGNENKETAARNYKHGYGAALFYNTELPTATKLKLAAGYNQDAYDGLTDSRTDKKDSAWLLSAKVVQGPFDFALSYGKTKGRNGILAGTTAKEKGDYWAVAAHYQVIEPSKVFLQWERESSKNEGYPTKEIKNHYIAGVDYKFHKNVVTYVQYQRETIKDSVGDRTNDNGVGVGLRVFF